MLCHVSRSGRRADRGPAVSSCHQRWGRGGVHARGTEVSRTDSKVTMNIAEVTAIGRQHAAVGDLELSVCRLQGKEDSKIGMMTVQNQYCKPGRSQDALPILRVKLESPPTEESTDAEPIVQQDEKELMMMTGHTYITLKATAQRMATKGSDKALRIELVEHATRPAALFDPRKAIATTEALLDTGHEDNGFAEVHCLAAHCNGEVEGIVEPDAVCDERYSLRECIRQNNDLFREQLVNLPLTEVTMAELYPSMRLLVQ
ncbi:Hypp8327 [Branchiostoma lanceolatum]|uniref:Hypp8327 protein n=1 Tax=Branchiostoma lanceolatum TaxID=7740 RepID=A0A8K0EH42_BRALA|nr:Hypp8327 [Branchiostoma lanceolatum]